MRGIVNHALDVDEPRPSSDIVATSRPTGVERMSRIVLITGGAGGIGRATGERFAAAGDTVVYADRSPEALEELGSDTIFADVTVVAGCERMIAQTVERHGPLGV